MLLALAAIGCKAGPAALASEVPDATESTSSEDSVVPEVEPSDSPELPIAFGYVTPGPGRDTGLPQQVDKGGLAWVAQIMPVEAAPAELIEVLVGFGFGEDDSSLDPHPLDPALLASLELAPPHSTIWLVDDEGVCEARLAAPIVAIYTEVDPTLELSWRLEGCDPDRAWAPIGLFTLAPPEQLRYVEAQLERSEAIEPARVEGRAATLVRENAAEIVEASKEASEPPPDEWWIRELAIPDTDIAQVQFAGLWRDHPARGEDYDDCSETATITRWTADWAEPEFSPFDANEDADYGWDESELVGAFVIGRKAKWLVYTVQLQALLVGPSRAPELIVTGDYHDEVVAFAGWSPAASCEP